MQVIFLNINSVLCTTCYWAIHRFIMTKLDIGLLDTIALQPSKDEFFS